MVQKTTKRVLLDLGLTLIGVLICAGLFAWISWTPTHALMESEGFGGATPIKVYQIYDKDTGVYYAVTDRGGICVMETADGETKLVDEGEPPVIHKNQGK